MCNAILDWAASEEIGFSKFASLGNRAVIDEASMLQFLAEDPQTSVIIGYLEGMNNGRRFARISQTITATITISATRITQRASQVVITETLASDSTWS